MVMSSRERVAAALLHKEPDRTPIFEYVLLSPVADALLGRPFADEHSYWARLVQERGWAEAVRQSARDHVELAARLGQDMLYLTPNPLPESTAEPQPEPVPSVPCPEDPVERVRLRTQQGEARFAAPPDACFAIYRAAQEQMQRCGLDLPILAPAYAHGIWTDTDLMQTLVLAPEVARQHFALATRRSLAAVRKYLELGIEHIGVGGDFAGNRPLISPKAYHEFIVPEIQRVTRVVHAAGRFAVNASDGNLWPVIEDFLFGCDVDGYIEIDLHAGMELARLKRAFGDRITLYGNLDCGNILSFGSVQDVRRHTIDCLKDGLGNGGHILCASNAITASVSVENYLAVVHAYRDFFGLPKLLL